jgi:hypothetical protein
VTIALAVLAPAAGLGSIGAIIAGLACYARAVRDEKREHEQETGS